MSDYGLKVGDKIRTPGGVTYDVLEVEGRFALIQWGDGLASPILFQDGAWRGHKDGPRWTVVKPRWRAERCAEMLVIVDGQDRLDADFGIIVYPDDIDADASEVVEAFVDLLNERFPA